MIFISSSLAMNGGTTFLLRACREISKRGRRAAIILITNVCDKKLKAELDNVADIYILKDFTLPGMSWVRKTQVSTFIPANKCRIKEIIAKHGNHFHAMGIFGILFSSYCKSRNTDITISVGIYHQNEFMFKGADFFFIKSAWKCFTSLPSKSVLFFNEHSRDIYSAFFSEELKKSPVTPIGITLPAENETIENRPQRLKITSIGNLHGFKTYNKNVIKLMPELLTTHPNAEYHIYGDGPMKNELKQLADSLHLGKHVFFHGSISYEEMAKSLKETLVFIGSGTAIIEASALGIPSIIGVESLDLPLTYGFFSSAKGFTYHEYDPNKETQSILDLILSISIPTAETVWMRESIACRSMARKFSIEETVNSLEKIESNANHAPITKAAPWLDLASFFYCTILTKLKINTNFVNRRNQGTIESSKKQSDPTTK